MYERFIAFLDTLSGRDAPGAKLPPMQLACAALMFAVMDADGYRHEAELAALESLLSDRFDLEGASLADLVRQGEAAEAEAVDLYQFTSVVVKLSETERLRFLGLLFDVVYADGELHELEDNLIWRIAELIGVAARDRVELRRQAAERLAAG